MRLCPGMATVMWFGLDAPHGTVYVPFYNGQRAVPDCYLEGMQSKFNPKSAYWAFNFLNNWQQLMWGIIHPVRPLLVHTRPLDPHPPAPAWAVSWVPPPPPPFSLCWEHPTAVAERRTRGDSPWTARRVAGQPTPQSSGRYGLFKDCPAPSILDVAGRLCSSVRPPMQHSVQQTPMTT